MVVNTSRFLTLDKKIPQVQVNNPDVLDVMPISPNQVQISAKRTGVTQVNLWGEDKRIYTVTVIVTGDAAELTEVLRELFPKTSLTIVPVNGNSVIISGYVDQQDAVPKIVAVAGKYFPDVINNMTVSGVQQGMLHVKVYEVSRTKLRNMGFDWANVSSNGNLVMSGVSGLLTTAAGAPSGTFGRPPARRTTPSSSARGRQCLLRRAQRPAPGRSCQAATRNRTSWPSAAGPPTCWSAARSATRSPTACSRHHRRFKEYGTRLDFVPIVLGNGRMHIDVRASVSEPDAANSIDGIPALTTREVETGVELRAGQTLAIAGLIQQHRRGQQPRFAVDQRDPLPGRALSLGQPSDQRDRAARARHAGDRRRHGARPGADLHARHADDRSQRLGTVLQRHWKFPTAARRSGRVPESPPPARPRGGAIRARARSAGKIRRIVPRRTRWP